MVLKLHFITIADLCCVNWSKDKLKISIMIYVHLKNFYQYQMKCKTNLVTKTFDLLFNFNYVLAFLMRISNLVKRHLLIC